MIDLYSSAREQVEKDRYCYGMTMTKWVQELGGSTQYPLFSLFHYARRLFTVDVDQSLEITCADLELDANMIRSRLAKLGVHSIRIHHRRGQWICRAAGVTSFLYKGMRVDLTTGYVLNPLAVPRVRRVGDPACAKEVRGEV